MSHCHTTNTNTNSKKTGLVVAGVGVFIVLLGAALFFSSSPQANNQPAAAPAIKGSVLQASEQFFDFGQISMAKGKVTKAFTIKNPTNEPIVASKVYTSCMCTQAVIASGGDRKGPFGMPGHGGSIPAISLIIAPNSEAVVEAIFDPAAHGPAGIGPVAREVYVETLEGGKLTLSFKANVIP